MMRLIELKDTFVGKVLAVFVSILLATSLINVAAFATGEEENSTTPYQESIDDRGATEASADTSSTDAAQEVTEPAQPAAQEPQAAEPATQEVVEPELAPAPEPEPAPAKESQNNAATSSDKGSFEHRILRGGQARAGQGPVRAAAPADATVKLKLNNASLVIKSDNNKIVASGTSSVKVDAQKKLEFKAVAADGYTLDTVKAKSNGAEIQLTEKAGDTYVVAAANVADGLEIDVTTEVVKDEEATEEESATEEGVTEDSEEAAEGEESEEGAEGEEATEEEVTDEVLSATESASNGISLLAATGDGIKGGNGSSQSPYQIEAGSSATITESYINDRASWNISEGSQNGKLSNKSIGNQGTWYPFVGWVGGEDAQATLTVNDNAPANAEIVVRFGSNRSNYEYTYFKVVSSVQASGIEVTIDSESIMVGETAKATATVEPENASYIWKSSNTVRPPFTQRLRMVCLTVFAFR